MNKDGFVLPTTLILSLVSVGLVMALCYLSNSGSYISYSSKKYTSSLEAARGAAEFVMKQAEWDEGGDILQCSGGSCNQGEYVDLGDYSSIGNSNVTVEMLSDPLEKKMSCEGGADCFFMIYSFRITAVDKDDSSKRAVIEVVYELEQ